MGIGFRFIIQLNILIWQSVQIRYQIVVYVGELVGQCHLYHNFRFQNLNLYVMRIEPIATEFTNRVPHGFTFSIIGVIHTPHFLLFVNVSLKS